jgi:sugar/nucleoside kinase (ribokinase family)
MGNEMKKAGRAQRPVVVGSGFVALDIVLSIQPDAPIRNYAGGTCGNVLAILGFLGWDAYPSARIGGDAPSRLLIDDLGRWNVDAKFLRREEEVLTPVIIQENFRKRTGELAHRFSWSCPECGAYWPSFRAITRAQAKEVAEQVSRCDVFFFDRASPGTIALAGELSSRGAIVMFEPSSAGDVSMFERAAKTASIIKYSTDRIKRLPLSISPHLEIRTLGVDGLQFRIKGGPWSRLGAIPRSDVIDTSGAGDWLSAGFLTAVADMGRASFLKLGKTKTAEALRHGQALAAWNCGFEGARGAMYHVSNAATLLRKAEALRQGTKKAIRGKETMRAALALSSVGDLCRSCEPATSAALAI